MSLRCKANNMSASSSSSFPSSSSEQQKYDVFLSFRGKDTRQNFTDHLHNALLQKGINTFMDDKLPRGEEISDELVKAIEESKVSIIIFSENYASSRWCLDELVKILQCRESNQHVVRPVFYKVKPCDVRNQRGSFGKAFAKLKCKFKDNSDKVNKWKAALLKAANLSGWPFMDGYESQFINNIVEELLDQVLKYSYKLEVARYPIEIESCVRDIDKLIDIEEKNVRMIGIWGTGGIGKTAIANAVYNSIAHKFEGRCYLRSVREISMNQEGLVKLQETLLRDILRDESLKIRSISDGVNMIESKVSRKKVLLILDDVSECEQLNYLARDSNWFGFGSRIIITTRDKSLLTAHQVHLIHEVKMLDDDGSLKLFSLNAFKRNGPPDDYLELARRAVDYAQGLPLALIVLGSHLIGRSMEQWEFALDKCKRVPHKKIQDILKISFDGLEDHLKEIFLDIACFFKGDDVDYVTRVLKACDLNPGIGIERLKEKALITIDRFGIQMHDLIEEMGKEIVRQESPDDLGKRNRLWLHEDVDRVLSRNIGTSKIKGIKAGLPRERQLHLNAKSFSEMKNLRFFMTYYYKVDNDDPSGDIIDYLSNEMRWLDWPGCPLQYFPSSFHPEKLAMLKIPGSCIRLLWKDCKNLQYLTSMDLRSCKFLKKIPDLSGAPNLERLNLNYCTRLVEIHRSVGYLNKLITLTLYGCSNLTTFPKQICMRSLDKLHFGGCERLKNFPEVVGNMDSLRHFHVEGCIIKELNSSIGYFTGLESLYINNCANISTMPCIILELQHLKILDVRECPKLVRFPSKYKSQVRSRSDADNISHDKGNVLPKLKALRFTGCNLSDADFLGTLDCQETLTELDLSSNNFVSLPACISKFFNLEILQLLCCTRLREIPELPSNLVSVDVSYCESLERFENFSKEILQKESQRSGSIKMRNCHRLCDNLGFDDMAINLESMLLNEFKLEVERGNMKEVYASFFNDYSPPRPQSSFSSSSTSIPSPVKSLPSFTIIFLLSIFSIYLFDVRRLAEQFNQRRQI